MSKLKFQHYNGREVCCKIAISALKTNKSLLLCTINSKKPHLKQTKTAKTIKTRKTKINKQTKQKVIPTN